MPEASAERVGEGMIWISWNTFIWSIGSGSIFMIAGMRANSSAWLFISPLRIAVQWLNRWSPVPTRAVSLASRAAIAGSSAAIFGSSAAHARWPLRSSATPACMLPLY